MTSCTQDTSETKVEIEKVPGINLGNMDTNVKPNEDFFRYVNGAWLDKTEIPDDRSSWGGFNELRKKTDADALEILAAAMSDNKELKIEIKPGSDQEKAVQLYQTIMDTVTRNRLGVEPLKPYLTKIEAVTSVGDLEALLIEMEPQGGIGFFGFGVGADAKNSNINAGYLGSGSLGLPDRDYYVKDDDDSKEKRAKYEEHIARMLQYIGDDEESAKAQATKILAFETKLARPMMDKVDRRDVRNRYNPKSIAELQEMVPAISWKSYFEGIGAGDLDTVVLSDPKYMMAVQEILAEGNVEDWKTYMRWSTLNSAASLLTTELETAN